MGTAPRRPIMDSDTAKPEASAQERSPQVTIYTSNDCNWCGPAKRYLSEHGVAFTEKNVEENDAWAMEAFALAGRRQTPVEAKGTDGGVGFQRPQLDALLPPPTDG